MKKYSNAKKDLRKHIKLKNMINLDIAYIIIHILIV